MGANAPAATLSALVRALGGDLYAGGRRALVPAPGHSVKDRSVSLLLENERVVAHSFGGAGWREVLDDLRRRRWIDAGNRLLEGGQCGAPAQATAPAATRAERIAVARRLWNAGGTLSAGCPAALHVVARGLDLGTASAGALRAHEAIPASIYHDRGVRRPALLAAVRDADGKLTAVEITYLDVFGRRSTLAQPPRKVVGVLPPGCAVRLSPRNGAMLVGEGVFTTLSAIARFDLPGWALLSTSNLRRWSPPEGVRRVLIAADRGRDGEASARRLQAELVRRGVAARVALPPAPFGDWNDWAMAADHGVRPRSPEEGAGGARLRAG